MTIDGINSNRGEIMVNVSSLKPNHNRVYIQLDSNNLKVVELPFFTGRGEGKPFTATHQVT